MDEKKPVDAWDLLGAVGYRVSHAAGAVLLVCAFFFAEGELRPLVWAVCALGYLAQAALIERDHNKRRDSE